jgi:hypothetical protein
VGYGWPKTQNKTNQTKKYEQKIRKVKVKSLKTKGHFFISIEMPKKHRNRIPQASASGEAQ